ncbi:complex I NDUFA9 subunit family protein [Bordetella genomosp. 12]|uniref:NAD-dependent dehydratase n=1 Tax=Bordetella genomosp. 12 TaxID=463035 RepID=A0A261VCF2_9BORD|nr:complex I NDUFA9 subunit family protein [Bordetella genomosp. 12]OZI71507.1 NAD-dependent dehydratase [Bordetella genomosp. 12]
MRILVTGGTGFIGRALTARLARAGHRVIVPTRRLAQGRELLVLPTVTVLERDVHDDAALASLLRGCDAAINLVGVLHGGRGKPYGSGFARAHVTLPRRLAQACLQQQVRRLLHVSALGADRQGPSMYLRSKGDGEAALAAVYAEARHAGWTILQPSVVFGPQDNFTNLFARLARWLPVLMVPGAASRVQPVYVGDVVQALIHLLATPLAAGRRVELAGPTVYTLAELASRCAQWSGHRRSVMALPGPVARLQAALFECLPGQPLFSRDNLDTLTRDSVASQAPDPLLGLLPTALEAVAPAYLGRR